MQKKSARKAKPATTVEEKVNPVKATKAAPGGDKVKPADAKIKQAANGKIKVSGSNKAIAARPVKNQAKISLGKKAVPTSSKVKANNKPSLRAVYSNSKYTLLPLGFATDFKTQKEVIIFSELQTGKVHTVALSVWNRWKLKEVKKINTET